MPNNLRNKIEILVFKEGVSGTVKTFKNIRDAASYFNVHRDTIMRRIINGETFDGYFLDWGLNTPAEIIKDLEQSYLKRFENNSRYSLEFYYRHVAQEEM